MKYHRVPAWKIPAPSRQDSILLNLQRCCEAAIDLAMHWVRVRRLGLPQESREAFTLLHDAGPDR